MPATRSGRTTHPIGAGPNQPQLDLTNVALSKASPSTLRVKMTVANLAGMLPPPGKANAVWLTRFQALSVGDFGEEAYRIFYVGAESTGGQAPQYFAGSTTCTDTTPQTCKVVDYPRTMVANGRVCGNTISVDVLAERRFRDRPAGRQHALQRHGVHVRAERRERHLRRRRRLARLRLRSRRPLGGDGLLSATRATSPARSRARSAPPSRAGGGPGSSSALRFGGRCARRASCR